MLKCFCDKCGKELTTGYMEIGAAYSHDPSPEAPGRKPSLELHFGAKIRSL